MLTTEPATVIPAQENVAAVKPKVRSKKNRIMAVVREIISRTAF
jgi:hypothetical protein